MDKIIYTTPKQQIAKLREQNLIINNEEFAETVLLQSGYSNLVKSYREPFVFSSDGKKRFVDFNIRYCCGMDDYLIVLRERKDRGDFLFITAFPVVTKHKKAELDKLFENKKASPR